MEAKKGSLIEVGMAEVRVGSFPDVLVTRGLGSCIGIAIYEPRKKIGALAHAMLPSIANAKAKFNPAKYVDSAVSIMIDELKKRGVQPHQLVAKLFGGAHMFSSIPLDSPFNVGGKNIDKAREILASYGIKVVGEDTGGNYGRTIFFDLDTGKVRIKTVFQGEKEV